MLCKCHWIVLYTVHFTAFCLRAVFMRTRCIRSTRTFDNDFQCGFCINYSDYNKDATYLLTYLLTYDHRTTTTRPQRCRETRVRPAST